MAAGHQKIQRTGGLLLFAAAAAALVIDNSALAWLYDMLLGVPFSIRLGELALDKPLLLWINDGLMAIFFLLVGLEIKREIADGELSTRAQAALPIVAAIGGIAMPALIFFGINRDSSETLAGWAIPAATDIAFVLGILALLGSRVPVALKVFLTAVAIIDDLGAILIIAFFYTSELSWVAIGSAALCSAVLIALNRFRVKALIPYLAVGTILWVCVLKSGVHATLAGVVVALALPMATLRTLERALYPWVALAIMPIFAFANAGVSLQGFRFTDLLQPLPLGIAAGLFVGKQLGVFGFTWLAVKSGIARLPNNVGWAQIYGASLLAGIGFTMSLFIGTLAFESPEQAAQVRIGVIAGSLLAGAGGFAVLRLTNGLTPARSGSPAGTPPRRSPDTPAEAA